MNTSGRSRRSMAGVFLMTYHKAIVTTRTTTVTHSPEFFTSRFCSSILEHWLWLVYMHGSNTHTQSLHYWSKLAKKLPSDVVECCKNERFRGRHTGWNGAPYAAAQFFVFWPAQWTKWPVCLENHRDSCLAHERWAAPIIWCEISLSMDVWSATFILYMRLLYPYQSLYFLTDRLLPRAFSHK